MLAVTASATTASVNYTVQMLTDLAPAGWAAAQWAATSDGMLGSAQAHILSNMIEVLGIKLKVPDMNIQEQIDKDHVSISSEPLKPYAVRNDWELLTKIYQESPETEEKLESHAAEYISSLALEDRTKLQQRFAHDLEIERTSENLGFLSSLPKKTIAQIKARIHSHIAAHRSLPPRVRAYKRFIAPPVVIVDLQNFLVFGFIVYRTIYENETAWGMEAPWQGTGLELIEERAMIAVEDDRDRIDGADFDACRKLFKVLSKEEKVPPGLNVGMVLVMDERGIKSLAEPERGMQNVWAADVGFEKGKKENPEGYDGVFEVSVHALLHSLFVGLAGEMEPVEIWKLLQRKESVGTDDEGPAKHEEL